MTNSSNAHTDPKRAWFGVFNADEAPIDTDVEAGVSSGYRVIDDYLQQGERAAQRLWKPLAALGADPLAEVPTAEVLLRTLSTLGSTWMSRFEAALGGGQEPPLADPTTAGPFRVGADAAPRASKPESALVPVGLELTLAIAAPWPVRLHVSATGLRNDASLRVSALRDATEEHRPIRDVTLGRTDGGLQVSANIPLDQPRATYVGVVFADDVAAGTLSLVLG